MRHTKGICGDGLFENQSSFLILNPEIKGFFLDRLTLGVKTQRTRVQSLTRLVNVLVGVEQQIAARAKFHRSFD